MDVRDENFTSATKSRNTKEYATDEVGVAVTFPIRKGNVVLLLHLIKCP